MSADHYHGNIVARAAAGIRAGAHLPAQRAGFMLLETKGVVHMALLFGSTWVINSVVFAAILVMILLSNLFVLTYRPRRLWPFYALLTATLLVNVLVPMSYFLSLPGGGEGVRLVRCRLRADLFRRPDFRHRLPQQPPTRPGLWLERRGVILGGVERILFAAAGVQPLATGSGRVLSGVSPSCGRGAVFPCATA